nr:hypothetical protein [Tanacetum cinerariifolium]
MVLTFVETHNMIAYLNKSDASEGFEQILDFLNASVIQYALTVAPTPPPSLIAQLSSPPPQQQPPQPSYDAAIFMNLLHTLLETCTNLTRKVEALEQDKIAQALEIIKLKERVRRLEKKNKLKDSGLRRLKKQRVRKLEKKNKLKVSRLRRLKKIGTAQRVESSADTIMDDQEDASKQGRDNSKNRCRLGCHSGGS